MDTVNDGELLRRHVEQGDEGAFAEVVQRHVNLVYATAKRLANGDAHLAEDISQQVFTALARNAQRLAEHPTLAGWLHTSTRHLVYKAIRTENRRRAREQELYTMQNIAAKPEVQWEKLQPVLDAAVAKLGDDERNAVLLRYFEDKSYREVGECIGLNEEAARKRVDRAVDKLRTHFSRKGITVAAGLLGEAITTHAAETAPAGLANSVAAKALVQAAASPVGSIYFLKVILTMTTTTKIIAVAATLLVMAASYHYFSHPAEPGVLPAAAVLSNEVKSTPPTVASVQTAPAPKVVSAATVAPSPNSNGAPQPLANIKVQTAAVVLDANTQEAAVMLSSMKLAFVDANAQLAKSSDLSELEVKFNALQAQMDELRAKVAGTPLEAQLTPAVNALKAVQAPLQRGDVAGVKTVLAKLSAGGPSVPASSAKSTTTN